MCNGTVFEAGRNGLKETEFDNLISTNIFLLFPLVTACYECPKLDRILLVAQNMVCSRHRKEPMPFNCLLQHLDYQATPGPNSVPVRTLLQTTGTKPNIMYPNARVQAKPLSKFCLFSRDCVTRDLGWTAFPPLAFCTSRIKTLEDHAWAEQAWSLRTSRRLTEV
jgi:hypothetical protein